MQILGVLLNLSCLRNARAVKNGPAIFVIKTLDTASAVFSESSIPPRALITPALHTTTSITPTMVLAMFASANSSQASAL